MSKPYWTAMLLFLLTFLAALFVITPMGDVLGQSMVEDVIRESTGRTLDHIVLVAHRVDLIDSKLTFLLAVTSGGVTVLIGAGAFLFAQIVTLNRQVAKLTNIEDELRHLLGLLRNDLMRDKRS